MSRASPVYSSSRPDMMPSSVDLPEPFAPSTPIFAPGKNDSEMSFSTSRSGGTNLPTRCMVKMYWALMATERTGHAGAPGHVAVAVGTREIPGVSARGFPMS